MCCVYAQGPPTTLRWLNAPARSRARFRACVLTPCLPCYPHCLQRVVASMHVWLFVLACVCHEQALTQYGIVQKLNAAKVATSFACFAREVRFTACLCETKPALITTLGAVLPGGSLCRVGPARRIGAGQAWRPRCRESSFSTSAPLSVHLRSFRPRLLVLLERALCTPCSCPECCLLPRASWF